MSYSSNIKNKSKTAYNWQLVLLIIFFISFVFLQPKSLRFAFHNMLSWPLRVVEKINFTTKLVDDVSDYFILHKKYQKAKHENEILKQEIYNLSYIDYENKKLKESSNFLAKKGKLIGTAYVAKKSNGLNREWYLLAGKKDGVKEGQIALSGNFLIGRIINVGESNSVIMPINDISSAIPVLFVRSESKAIVSGTYHHKLEISTLEIDEKPESHELVVTSGDGNIFPPGLLIGVVAEENQSDIEPIIDLEKISMVSILEYQ